ncbi:MAG: type II toxin-antitoxin system Phd/YefM family antitoxin [Candidatus Marinimicrobia bacterium]|nr:type II toxin-antitoxin system Phd/YefM family antitoxin [Candidatus Neomarinimicrobiota bacterium]
MKPSETVKSISYLKANASEIIRDIINTHKTLIITQNSEAKAILQDIKKYEPIPGRTKTPTNI